MPVRKTLILGIALLLVGSAGAMAASRTVNWTITGAAIGTPAEGIVSTYSDCGRLMLIQVHAKGSPGSAEIFGINLSCSPDLAENSLVARFKDGSLLNFIKNDAIPPEFSFDPATGFATVKFSLIVSGGFGRFNDASGDVDAVLHVKAVAPGSLLQYEYGTLKGKIYY
jgi:hypothetical protein